MDGRPLIAIFCNSFPPEGGAASHRMYRMAKLLNGAGFRVEVVSSMPNYPHGNVYDGYRGTLSRREHVDGIAVQRCWIYPSNSRFTVPRGISLITQSLSFRWLAFRRIRNLRPALVIASSPPLPMASAAVSYFRKAGVPVLLNVSDLWPLSAKVLGAAGESRVYRYLQRLEHRMYRQASAVSAQSTAILDHIAAALPAAKPAFLLRNLPDTNCPLPQNKPNASGGPLRIIYPGLLGQAQGLLALMRALDWQTLGARLEIFGSGAETGAIRTWLAAHPDVAVQLRDPVSETALRQLLPGFDAMLVPLVSDIPGAVPSKLFTAIHAGLPVVYSAGGEGADIVRNHGLGFVSAPGDYGGLARSIQCLSTMSDDGRARIRAAMRQAAETLFDPRQQDARFLEFIHNLFPPENLRSSIDNRK